MAVTLKTYGEQLQEVQEAISAVLTSQRYEINGRVQQRADLEQLQEREEYLTGMYNRHGNTRVGEKQVFGSAQVSFTNEG